MRLIEVEMPLDNSANVARLGATLDWDVVANPDRSKLDDADENVISGAAPMPGNIAVMRYLRRMGFTTPARVLELPLHSIKVKARVRGGPDAVCYADSVRLVKGGSILNTVDKGGVSPTFVNEQTNYYTFGPADLASMSVTRADLFSNPADFGAVLGITTDDTVSVAGQWAAVDQLALVFVLIEQEDDVDAYRAGQGGGFEVALKEALPSVSSSAAIFANCPDDVVMIELTVRTADLVICWNEASDIDAATTTNGNTYAAGGTYRLYGNETAFKSARAIQSGGTAAGHITYWKNA